VASAGFGDAQAPPSAGQRRPSPVATAGFGETGISSAPGSARAAVRSSGFGDAVSAAPSARGARPDAAPAITVARILEKPRPAYSEEARRLQIEGEVQLEILFGASGEIRILRVVRGLGHGLDENAAQAARTIRFLPARRDGRAVDSTATVHILFQLAS
jgi:TonB family protein